VAGSLTLFRVGISSIAHLLNYFWCVRDTADGRENDRRYEQIGADDTTGGQGQLSIVLKARR
jgi:hypothetical protein